MSTLSKVHTVFKGNPMSFFECLYKLLSNNINPLWTNEIYFKYSKHTQNLLQTLQLKVPSLCDTDVQDRCG